MKLIETFKQNLRKTRFSIANWLAGDNFEVAPKDSVRLAGCVVLWFEKEGFRHYVTLRTNLPGQDNFYRFPSFFGLMKGKDASETIKTALKAQLGEKFSKRFDFDVLNLDRISSTPTFRWTDSSMGSQDIVQVLVWTAQISPDHADQIKTLDKMDYRSIPEFAINGSQVSMAHKQIFQSVRAHVTGISGLGHLPEDVADKLQDMFNETFETPVDRTIH